MDATFFVCFVFQGFLDLKMKSWLRNLITRLVAFTPSLIVSIIGGSAGAGKLIIIASVSVYDYLTTIVLKK